MSEVLDTAKFVWEIMKDGAKLTTAGQTVNLLPQGTNVSDISNWQGPVSYPEYYDQLSAIFESTLAAFTLTANWQYNGTYIANFNVLVEGSLDVLSTLDVSATTLAGSFADDGVAELPYQIAVVFKNVIGGSRETVFRGVARGDGGGRSTA
ncbi:hypothetical protein [Silvimonas amylolytica]|uniref:Uncharacterized protein n=1 Tax=Silvimonas amylolytica TaxID=449663 RepID=A0ABQ2PH34_9NEIS|nr:hypothetical protein [Silvimonas amylolytica]GGP24890.1 hypothetical protein GCM10010971_07090 [Silvimonas amylolytica]